VVEINGQFGRLPLKIMGHPDLTAGAKVFYAYLDMRQGKNGASWAGRRRAAYDLNTSTASIHRWTAELTAAGLLTGTAGQGTKASHLSVSASKMDSLERVQNGCASKMDSVRVQNGRASASKMDSKQTMEQTNEQTISLARCEQSARSSDDLADLLIPDALPQPKRKRAKPVLQQTPEALAKAEAIYAAYPRHIAKPTAIKAILKALAKRPTLLADVTAYAERCRGNGQEPQFIPHPATWMNQERWGDEREPDSKTTARAKGQAALERLRRMAAGK
jgi:hypothetical protein